MAGCAALAARRVGTRLATCGCCVQAFVDEASMLLLPTPQSYGGYGPEELAALLATEAGAAVEERRKEALDILDKVRRVWDVGCGAEDCARMRARCRWRIMQTKLQVQHGDLPRSAAAQPAD